MHELGRQLARKEARKRARSDSESEASALSDADDLVEDKAVQKWLVRALRRAVGKLDSRNEAGALFVARAAVGAWVVLQAMRPRGPGPAWFAQLAVCLQTAVAEFNEKGAGVAAPDAETIVAVMDAVVPEAGRAGGEGRSVSRFVGVARECSRQDAEGRRAQAEAALALAQNDRAARLALRAALMTCRRARALFND